MTLVYAMGAALVVAVVVIVCLALEVRRLRFYSSYLERMAERARVEAMAAEARSRGVGGTGEHGAPVVTVVDPVSRVWTMGRDPRWTIPSDRAR